MVLYTLHVSFVYTYRNHNQDSKMPEPTSEAPQASSNEPSGYLLRTETRQSLRDLGVSENIPLPDSNYPEVGRETEPVFPEEYTLETSTGLVGEQTLRSIRSTASTAVSRRHTRQPTIPEENIEKATEPFEFVTFKIGDSENPLNWPSLYRWYITIVVSILVVCISFGSSIVTGGLGLVEEKYNVSLEVAILTCSIMVLGFAVGPLLWSPLSEIVGRRPIYIISMLLYVIFNFPAPYRPTSEVSLSLDFCVVSFLARVFR
jgi:hypothetical protein